MSIDLSETILIVSPAEDTIQTITEILNSVTPSILSAQTIDEAKIFCTQQTINLVLLDDRFGSDGIEAFCTGILDADQATQTKLMMILSNGNEDAKVQVALEIGAIDIIVRPVIPGLLRQRVHWIIQSQKTSIIHAALRQSEERLRTIITNANLILFAFDPQGLVTFIDGQALENVGRSGSELLGRSIFDMSVRQIIDDAKLVLKTQHPLTSTIEYNNHYFEVLYNPVLDEHGSLVNIIGVATDVTQREQAEQQLEKSLNFYLTFFEDFPVPIWRSGTNGHLDYLNQSWLSFVGQTLEDAISKGWYSTIFPVDRIGWQEAYVTHFKDRTPFELEYRMLRHDGVPRDVVNIGKPLYNIEGNFAGYIGLIYDITDRKEAETKIIDLNIERERVTMLQEFISTVSHDLKTPLSNIILYANLLRSTNTPDQRFEYTQIVEQQSRRLQDMLDNMIQMTRLDQEITTLTFQLANVDAIVENVAQFYGVRVKAKNLKYVIDIQKPLPKILANEVELRRGLANLVDNAVKYTDEGTITIRVLKEGQFIIVEVADTGIGISLEDQAKVFDRFYRADESRSTAGTGLGLTIVKKIVEAHGGYTELKSVPNAGTTIRMFLPTMESLIGPGKMNIQG